MIHEFKGTEAYMRKLFALLEDRGSSHVSVARLTSSRILSHDELPSLLPPGSGPTQLNFEEFCVVLLEKYEDPEACDDEFVHVKWRNALRAKFRVSRGDL